MTVYTEVMPACTEQSNSTSALDLAAPRHRWTRTDLYRMLEAGLLPEGPGLELIDGDVIDKMPQKRNHARTVSKAGRLLEAAFGSGYHAIYQSPLFIAEDTEPEPDVMIVRGDPDDYDDHPRPTDVALLLEVADTTLAYDRGAKARLYASAGIADYWIAVLSNGSLEVRRNPGRLPGEQGIHGYRSLDIFQPTDDAAPLLAPDSPVTVAHLFPQARAG